MKPDRIHIIGGGTFSHVRNHLALSAPAFGETAHKIERMCWDAGMGEETYLHLTKMADPRRSKLETNEDVAALVDRLIADPRTRVIVMNAALCDYDGSILMHYMGDGRPAPSQSGKYEERLKTSFGKQTMELTPADKLIGRIRKTRKDIFVVGFKTTTGASSDEQYAAALHLLKANSVNLVLANDTVTRNNMVVAPEETRYHETTDREEALRGLVEIMGSRMLNTFTRSTVIDAPPVPWDSEMIPDNLRKVVQHCIDRGAYKPFRGATVGHFAVKVNEDRIITSGRKRNFNNLPQEGMVMVDYVDDTQVIAHGAKPSVGGQSQRIIYREHPDAECIVHFHCPPRPEAAPWLSHVDQRPNECGSHQCGAATSRGLRAVSDTYALKAVMLDSHGPNIVFRRDTPSEVVIDFIETHFDLSKKTGGLIAA